MNEADKKRLEEMQAEARTVPLSEQDRKRAEEVYLTAFRSSDFVSGVDAIAAALAQARREGMQKIAEWAAVAFYPGPIEDEQFQAGYMQAIHEAERVITLLLAKEEA